MIFKVRTKPFDDFVIPDTRWCQAQEMYWTVLLMTLMYEHAYPYSVISQYDLNPQLKSPALTSLQTYVFMHLNHEMSGVFFWLHSVYFIIDN